MARRSITPVPNNRKSWLVAMIMIIILILIMIFSGIKVYGQEPARLSITEAYHLARQNYPLIKQHDLITKTKDYSVSNAAKGYLPMLSINGQATYQSTVTSFPFTLPIKGFTLPQYSKDQYKAYGEVDQVIYDGGVIKNQKQNAEANEVIQQQSLEAELYAIYDRVNQLFFGAMLVNEQLKQNDLLKQDIQNGIDKVKAQVANGTAYRSSADELSAQLLQAEQARTELIAARKAYLQMLSLFINKPLNENTVFERQSAQASAADTINRPEMLAYDYQKKTFDLQDKLLGAQLRPKFGFFIQGGYGRPGLNPLSNDFAWYYIGGLKLSWNFGSLYTLKNQKRLIGLGKENLDVEKEAFVFNTKLVQKQQNTEIEKYIGVIQKDDAIIALRQSVKNAAQAQLENGVLSAHDFIDQVNAEDQARQNLILHQVQLLQAQYTYQNIIGNIKDQ